MVVNRSAHTPHQSSNHSKQYVHTQIPKFSEYYVTRSCAGRTGAYRGVQGRTGAYRGVQGRTGAYRGVQGRTGAYRGVQGRTGAYRGVQGQIT